LRASSPQVGESSGTLTPRPRYIVISSCSTIICENLIIPTTQWRTTVQQPRPQTRAHHPGPYPRSQSVAVEESGHDSYTQFGSFQPSIENHGDTTCSYQRKRLGHGTGLDRIHLGHNCCRCLFGNWRLGWSCCVTGPGSYG